MVGLDPGRYRFGGNPIRSLQFMKGRCATGKAGRQGLVCDAFPLTHTHTHAHNYPYIHIAYIYIHTK